MKRPRPMSRSALLLAIVMAITWGLGAAQEQAAAVDTEKKVFVATKDWQPIPEGYSIPQVRKEGILSPLSLRPLLLDMHAHAHLHAET